MIFKYERLETDPKVFFNKNAIKNCIKKNRLSAESELQKIRLLYL